MSCSFARFICFVCKNNVRSSDLKWHLKQMHNVHDNNTSLICFQDKCMRTFERFSSYKKHLHQCHENQGKNADQSTASTSFNPQDSDLETESDLVSNRSDVLVDSDLTHEMMADNREYDITAQAASFVARMRAKNSMTMQNVDMVIESASEMVSGIVSHLQEYASNLIRKHIPADAVQDVLQKVRVHFEPFKKPFQGLETQWKEDKYFKETGCLIVPEETVLGHRIDQRNNSLSASVQQVVVSDSTYYIPISKVLKKFLELPGVWDAIQTHVPSGDGVLRDFHDGRYHKDHNILSTPNCIALGLYNDDMETVNPLGSHVSVHKLGFFYYIIKNLPPKYNSVLCNCHLLQVYHAGDARKYGFADILQPFVDEVYKLEVDGLDLNVAGHNINVKVTLGQVSGDNLGMHSLFGFVEGFTANYPCRLCTVHKKDLQKMFVEDTTLLRTRDGHCTHVQCATADGSSSFGVVSESALNKLKHFHVIENYTCDAMHDILEGVCGYELKLVLFELIYTKKCFDLNLLNDRIRSFNYSPAERGSKPVTISVAQLRSADGTIKQSASEMWCLITNLPIMMGDKVARDEPLWELLLSLLDVMSIVFASAVSDGGTYYLQSIIADHLLLI